MATDQGPVVQSALLRGDLVRFRKESGFTQDQIAAELDWSQSKLIRIEGGRSSITKVDLDALLTKYGVTSESTRERLQALNRGAREPAWWDKYRNNDVHENYLKYVGFEAGASFIRQFESAFVPAGLQTPAYAEAVTVGLADPVQVRSVVDLRLERQAKLAERSVPPRRYYVIDEAVIRRHIGISKDPAIMPNQILSIADKAEKDDLISVRVMPFAVGATRGMFGPFTLLEFDGGLPDILYIDVGRAELTSMAQGGDLVGEYRDDFEHLVEEALPAAKSIDLLRQVAEEMS